MTRTALLLPIVVISLLAAGCARSGPSTGPPEIAYGRDLCVECGMIISEPRFAAAYRLPDGTEAKFDDLGGLLIHGHETGELDEATVWVHDYDTEEWIEAEAAFYVVTGTGATPMGYGIFSFADRATAERFAAEADGAVMTWEELTAIPTDQIGTSGSHP